MGLIKYFNSHQIRKVKRKKIYITKRMIHMMIQKIINQFKKIKKIKNK